MRRTLCAIAIALVSGICAAQSQGSASVGLPPTEQAVALKTASEPLRATVAMQDARASEWWERSEWWLVISVWTIALAGIGIAVHTSRLWRATSDLLKTTGNATRKELRAYVALDEIFFEETGDNAPAMHKLRIRNYGQTPAYRMSIWCERASHLPKDGVTPYYDAPIVDGQLLHPVQAYTVALASAPLYRIGKPGFFTYGRIIYRDIHGDWWVTKFCFRYEGDGTFVPHGDYNDEEGPFENRPT